MTRTGKIARLAYSIRELLNQRLRNGEPAVKLAAWLNSLPAVQNVLREEFGGQRISPQNLSQWKGGGYQDWLKTEEQRRWVSELSHRGSDLEEAAGDFSITDWLATSLAVAMGRCLEQTAKKAGRVGKAHRQDLLELSREISRLRRGDHEEQWLKIARERWEQERTDAEKAEMEAKRAAIRHADVSTRIIGNLLREEYRAGMADGSIAPERAEEIRELFTRLASGLRKCGVGDLPVYPSDARTSVDVTGSK